MSEHNQSRNSNQNPPPETRTSSEATGGESSGTKGRRRGKIRRFLGKVKNATQKISHSPKDSRGRDPVLPNVDREGASSTANIEVRDAPSGVEQGADPQSALQDAKEAVKLMKPLSISSTPQDIRQYYRDACGGTSICQVGTERIVLGRKDNSYSSGSRYSNTRPSPEVG
ncbi:hypothetical protein DFJ58DRAFT_504138 [Suillus subalutaceus]|uniref:uncharacterized protein n=1 Tax=Suillus subalutaceus TaxID=48586 RepID=UPI001B85F97F|nr:uncharacterized protein DFJ58DRAFT_504138 [Suillus subalutaceus]KAG1845902.1 hypothetical protein DFJ58DRAFT_504138 [Suillus subalutaceus]